MVVPTSTLNRIKALALDAFDDTTHFGFGTSTTAEVVGGTQLGAEVQRNSFDESSEQNDVAGTYDFYGRLSLGQANGNTIAEVGIFTSSSGGTMRIRKVLPVAQAKTSDIDLTVGVRTTITVVNL